MFVGTILFISILVALVRGGRFRQEIPGLIYPIAGILVQRPLGLLFPGTTIGTIANLGGYLLALPFLWLNRRSVGMALITAGLLMNLVVIAANDGRMPVDHQAVVRAGVVAPAGELAKHQPMTAQTRLAILGDWIPLRFPFRRVLSVGDLFLFSGVFLFVQEISGRPLLRWRPPGSAPQSV